MAFGTGRTLVMGGHSWQKQQPRQIQPLERRQRNRNFRQCWSLLINSWANISKYYPVHFLMNLVDVLPQLLRIPKPCFRLEELMSPGTQLQRSTVDVESTDLHFGSTAQNHFRMGVGKLKGQVRDSGQGWVKGLPGPGGIGFALGASLVCRWKKPLRPWSLERTLIGVALVSWGSAVLCPPVRLLYLVIAQAISLIPSQISLDFLTLGSCPSLKIPQLWTCCPLVMHIITPPLRQ